MWNKVTFSGVKVLVQLSVSPQEGGKVKKINFVTGDWTTQSSAQVQRIMVTMMLLVMPRLCSFGDLFSFSCDLIL